MAARALAAACRYGEWRERPEGNVPVFDDVDPATARAVVDEALAGRPEGTWLAPESVAALLGAYRIPLAPIRRVSSVEEAVAAAQDLGFPVVLKAASPELVHKSDVGGVRLGLADAGEVRRAFEEMAGVLGGRMGGAVVQRMVEAGVETIVGVVQDPAFGPLVMFGSGGIAVELFGDRAFRILPLTDLDAAELVRSTKGSPLLFGYRGAPPADVDALCELLLRVARLADDLPELAE
ncbi:MAG: GNAT family N-acetyltransferase, partial [Acidimicrobiia bacterium]